jgi:hypothetical protein
MANAIFRTESVGEVGGTESLIWLEMDMDDMSVGLQTEMVGRSPTFTYSCPSVGTCNTVTCSTRSNTSCSCF